MSASKHIEPDQIEQKICEYFPNSYEPGSPIDKAITAGRGEGELVGQIRLLQNLLGVKETAEAELYAKQVSELQSILNALKAQLAR